MADLFNSFRRLDSKYRVKYDGPCNLIDSDAYETRGHLHSTLLHMGYFVINYCVEKGQEVTVNLIDSKIIEIVGYGPWYKSKYGNFVRDGESHLIWIEKED